MFTPLFGYNTQYNILYWVLFGFPFQNKYCFDYCLFFLLVLKYCFGYCLFFRWDGDIVLFIAWLLILGGGIVLVIVCCFHLDFLIVLYIVLFLFWMEKLHWVLVPFCFPSKYFIGYCFLLCFNGNIVLNIVWVFVWIEILYWILFAFLFYNWIL